MSNATGQARIVLSLDLGNLPPNAARAATAVQSIGKASVVSAGQTRAALQQLPAQFNDIAVSLAGGQNPLLVLLQQGTQIRDSFGGVREAIAGVGSVVTLTRSGIALLATAVAAIGTAAALGFREANRLRDTLILTGNAAGQTADSVADASRRISVSTGQTVGAVRGIVTALAATGRTSGEVLESQARAVARLADLTGQAGDKLAGQFADQLKAPAAAAARLNEQYNFLDIAQFKRIQQLEREGKAVAAVNLTNELLEQSLSAQASQLGTLERLWDGFGKSVSRAWDALKDIGRPETTSDLLAAQLQRLQGLQQQLANNQTAGRGEARIPGLGSQNDGLREQIRQAQESLRGLQRRQDIERTNAAARSADALQARQQIAAAQETPRTPRTPVDRGPRDPLGNFLQETVLPADTARQEARLRREEDYLQRVTEANDRAALRLIEDERARGLALIELDRAQAVQRLDEAQLSASKRTEVLQQIDRQVLLQTEELNATLNDKNRQRRNDEVAFLQQLADDNERAALELIADERQRGAALIQLDRSVAVRRLNEAKLSAEARAQALQEIDRGAAIKTELQAKESTDNVSEFTRRAAGNIQDALGNSLVSLLRGDFKSLERLWADTITNLVAQAAAAQLARALFGNNFGSKGEIGGLLGNVLSVIGGFFGQYSYNGDAGGTQFSRTGDQIRGRRATGGRVQAGQAYLVGELRPEIFVPDVGGYIQPEPGIQRMTAGSTVQPRPAARMGQGVAVADTAATRLADRMAVMPAQRVPAPIVVPGAAAALRQALRNRRATGGRVRAGEPYMVGELRPERFVPDVNGYAQTAAAGGGAGADGGAASGGITIDYAPVFHINGDVSPQTVALVRAEARAQQEELLRRLSRQGRL